MRVGWTLSIASNSSVRRLDEGTSRRELEDARDLLGVDASVSRTRLQDTYQQMGLNILMQNGKTIEEIKEELKNLYRAYKTLSA